MVGATTQTVLEMLPHLVTSGHSLYVKCTECYLQSMINLWNEHPDVYCDLKAGFHVVRSDRQWAGLSTDLVIEQVLMRSLKTSRGLMRGRAMTEQQGLNGCYQCCLWQSKPVNARTDGNANNILF